MSDGQRRSADHSDSRCEARFPPSLRPTVEQRLALAARERVVERLREADPTLWGPLGTPEVADRLGWLTIAPRMLAELPATQAFAREVRQEGATDVVLLGMGGSSLAPEVMRRSFGPQTGSPRLHVLDSTDAATIRATEQAVDLARTLFVVSSKSGGTIEPLSLFAHFWSLSGGDGERFVAITDPGSGLERLAREQGFRRVFHGDPDIGGRYSALSPFGVVPATLMGIDMRPLLEGAASAWDTPIEDVARGAEAPADPASQAALERCAPVWLGAALSALAQAGRDKLTFLIAPSLPGLGLWLEQLVAESTGKRTTGILPVAEEPLGAPEVYGEDRVFAYLPDPAATDPALEQGARALSDAGHPVITIPARGTADLGRVFMLSELAVAVAGWGLQINPFDQPNVQQAKDATNRVLEGYESHGGLPEVPGASEEDLEALLLGGGPPGYVAIMAYAQPSSALDEAVAELRAAVRAATRCTTTFGYGPRFLHSTGQFHKGGPPTGRFLQLLHDGPEDVEIPRAPYTFTTLKEAQAIGDLQTLRELGRAAERVRLEGADPARALRELTARLQLPAQASTNAGAGASAHEDPSNQHTRPQAG